MERVSRSKTKLKPGTKMLTDEEKQRVNRICKALLHERRIWIRKWNRWFNNAKENRDSSGIDEILKHDDKFEPFRNEMACIMRKAIPEFRNDHVSTMVDLYAAEHGFRWDGEPLKKGDEIWIGVGNARIERSQDRSN